MSLKGGLVIGADGAVYVNGATGFLQFSGVCGTAFKTFAYPSGAFPFIGVSTFANGPDGEIAGFFAVPPPVAVSTPPEEVIALVPSTGSLLQSQLFGGAQNDNFSFDSMALVNGSYIWAASEVTFGCLGCNGFSVLNASLQEVGGGAFDSPVNAMTQASNDDVYAATRDGHIEAIDPVSKETLWSVSVSSNESANDIVEGPDHALWFTFGNAIGRLTLQGQLTSYPVPSANAVPTGIAAGRDALWFTEPGANKIGRISLNGKITEFPVPTANADPLGIAVRIAPGGESGEVYFAENHAIGQLADL